MEERSRDGSPSLSQATLRTYWRYEEEEARTNQFISAANYEERKSLSHKDKQGYASAMSKWPSNLDHNEPHFPLDQLLKIVRGESPLAPVGDGGDDGESFDLDVSGSSGSED